MSSDRIQSKPTGLPIIHPFAAGIDIGSRFNVAAVSPYLCDQPVQTFQAFTSDLIRMADWLIATGVKTVAMESTGVYWVAAYEVLEARGLDVILANAREARNVPGRKSDINDAQWLPRLHACSLLRANFRPEGDIAELRSYLHARDGLSMAFRLQLTPRLGHAVQPQRLQPGQMGLLRHTQPPAGHRNGHSSPLAPLSGSASLDADHPGNLVTFARCYTTLD